MIVYYVTRPHEAAQAGHAAVGDLGKFFERAHADAFAREIGRGAVIEEREESVDAQHPSHRAKPTAPPSRL